MDNFEIANVLVSLGGDHGNQVPRYDVTAAELAVLLAIHGQNSITGIEPCGFVERSPKAERERLNILYGMATGGDGNEPILKTLFPGIGARLPTGIAELEIPEPQFAAVRTKPVAAVAVAPVAAEAVAAPVAVDTAAKPTKAPARKRVEDGVQDMND